MSLDVILVDLAVAAGIVWVVWYFWLSESKATRVTTRNEGVQEARIEVKGGYTPDRLIVSAGTPIRLLFERQETSLCSEIVEFPDLDVSTRLPEGQVVPVELPALEPGEYPFTCQMGMLRGKLVVVGDGQDK